MKRALFFFSTLLVATACHAGGDLNTSFVAAGEGVDTRNRQTATTGTSSVPDVPPSTSASAAPAPASTVPPTDACPLTCNEAHGSLSLALTPEEHAQLRSSLEPMLSKMRQCVSAEEWRRRGSPVIQLRIGVDGTISEHGVDPDHDHSINSNCFEDASRSVTPSANLPGRKSVRCREHCAHTPISRGRRGRP